MKKIKVAFFLVILLFQSTSVVLGNIAKMKCAIICTETGIPKVAFAIKKVRSALSEKGIETVLLTKIEPTNASFIIAAGSLKSPIWNNGSLKNKKINRRPESLAIWKTNLMNRQAVAVKGFDQQGLMYGLLDIAERISCSVKGINIFEAIEEADESPAVEERAVSFYTMNRRYWESRFYNADYWQRYFSLLAQSRFNMLTIIFGYENGGFLAPCYPYFFNVDGFAMIKMIGLSEKDQKMNLATMNHLIDMAHAHGIKVTLGIWDHIFRGGIQTGDMDNNSKGAKILDGIVTGLNAKNLIPYTTSALDKLIEKMPGLDAIQFRMHGESGLMENEEGPFWNRVFNSVNRKHPNIRLVLRAKGLSDDLIQDAVKSGVHFSIATKFWMEQTGLPYSPTHVNLQDQHNRRHGYADMLRYPQLFKMYFRLWTGGTNRVLTWGDPNYASRFIKSLDIYNNATYGFDVNEMLATKMESQPHDEAPFELLNPDYRYSRYEFERYWDFYLSFGRMGYNPSTSSTLWKLEYDKRFGDHAGPFVMKAVHLASKILPRIVASCYNYSFFPTTRGWPEKQRLGDLDVYARAQGSDIEQFASFEQEAELILNGGEIAKVLPSTNSNWFNSVADQVDSLVSQANQNIGTDRNKAFNATMVDLRMLACLARYHARRIPAAIYYNIFLLSHNNAALDSAIANEKNAISAWKDLVNAAGDMYAPDLKFGLAHTSFEGVKFELTGHWKDELKLLEKDLIDLKKRRDSSDGKSLSGISKYFKSQNVSTNAQYFTVVHQPATRASSDSNIVIRAQISGVDGIEWVKLRYRAVNQYLDFKTCSMLPVEKNVYEAIIPAKDIDIHYDLMYFMEMMDKKHHGFIYPDLNFQTPYEIIHLHR